MTFERGIRIILDSRPRFELTPQQAVTWKILLADISDEALLISALMLSRESKWEPSPSEWRDRALAVDGRGSAARLTAAEAWDEMRRNRRRYSPTERNRNHEITWTSQAVKRAAEAVNWTDMGWESESLPTIRAQFERYYNAIADKESTFERVEEARELLPMVERLIGRMDVKRLK